MSSVTTSIGIMLIMFSILAGIVLAVVGIYVEYQYESQIGAYFENARDSITPEVMLEQLNAGRQAMIDAGLREDMYGAVIFKKPDNIMKFQYQHLDGIIERAKAVIDWKNKMYSNESLLSETMEDVYNEKMDNLRKYIHAEGFRSDWIAGNCWWIQNHIILYFWWMIGLILIIIFILGCMLIGVNP